MAITVDQALEPASVTLTLSPGSEPFPESVTFEALDGNGDVGTGAAQVAAGDHGHAGVYEPADATILKDADIGSSVAAQSHNHAGTYEPADATILKDADIGTTVQGYDADTAKLDVAQSWTATQSFSTITGTTVTVSSPGTAQSVALDGRCHVIELADSINTEITGAPGTGFSNCLVRIKQPAVGSGTISWATGHVRMNAQDLNATAGAYTDFMLDSHDGSTVLYRGVGVEP